MSVPSRFLRVTAFVGCMLLGATASVAPGLGCRSCPEPRANTPGIYVFGPHLEHGSVRRIPLAEGTATLTVDTLTIEYAIDDGRQYIVTYARQADEGALPTP